MSPAAAKRSPAAAKRSATASPAKTASPVKLSKTASPARTASPAKKSTSAPPAEAGTPSKRKIKQLAVSSLASKVDPASEEEDVDAEDSDSASEADSVDAAHDEHVNAGALSEDDASEDEESDEESDDENDNEKNDTKPASASAASSSSAAASLPVVKALPSPAKENDGEEVTFESLGLMPELCSACATMGFTTPTPIQREAIPNALRDRDLIGLAQTGSGKTAAFSLPILQALWKNPSRFFACVLSPTRELAYQIAEQITSLGADIGVRCVVIVGGMSMMDQALALSKNPHIVIGTPGRLIDHLENTKGFSLKTLKYLVLDEADRLLDMDFGPAIEKLLKAIPRERHTYLFSATMTTKVEKLQKASLKNPYKVEIATKYSTVANLLQYYMFIPFKHKELYLAYLLSSGTHRSTILFTYTATTAQKLSLMLRHLGFRATCLYGTLSQPKRLAALEKFKSGERSLLVATDVASRGLDIPSVDLVVNYDVPQSSKDYIHRAGRTARAGRAGKCVTLVSQYDIEWYQRIEYALQKKLDAFPVESKTAVMALAGRVNEALKVAQLQLKEEAQDRKEVTRSRKGPGGGSTKSGGPPRKRRA